MGIVISTGIQTSPLSLTSTVIGFVSFTITLATLVRVFWANIQTIWAADTEIYDYLGNLKAALWEERAHLRKVVRSRSKSQSRNRNRRRTRSGGGGRGRGEKDEFEVTPYEIAGDRTLLLLRDTVRHMIRRFQDYERPFVDFENAMERRNTRRLSRDYEADWHSLNRGEDGLEEHTYGDTTIYRTCGLRERWKWLRVKSGVVELYDGLSKIQIRRIANELGIMYRSIHHLERDSTRNGETLQALEQRLSRVVGVRRAD